MSVRTGEIVREADLVSGAGDEQALLNAGALQNAIFNSANFSSIATDAKGVIQIFNVGAERMLGYTAAEVTNMITPADISDPQELIARAGALSLELGTPITPGFQALAFKASRGIEDIYELTYIRKDRSRFPAVVSVTALRDARDAVIGYLLIGTDNTARKLAEETLLKVRGLQAAAVKTAADAINDARIYSEAIVQTIRQPLLVLNGDLRVQSANPAFYELFKVEEAETEGALVYELGNDQWDIPRLRTVLTEVVSNNHSFTGVEVEHDFREIGRRIMVLNAIKLTREGEGDELILLAIEDITERKQAIAHQHLLVAELNHRVKNTLATVQAIAAQTLHDRATMKEAREAFDSRLSGLATAHDLLKRGNWAGADLVDIVTDTVQPHAGGENRFRIEGPHLQLNPAPALSLAMALHELCTNAAKYGALSTTTGHVDIVWHLTDSGESRRLLMRWTESDGPIVVAPTRKGFGSRLIERALAMELGGDVAVVYEASGVTCTIEAPMPVGDKQGPDGS